LASIHVAKKVFPVEFSSQGYGGQIIY